MSVFHQTQRAGSFPGRCSRWERIRLGLRSLRRCDGRRAEIDGGDAGQALGLLSLPEEGPLMVITTTTSKNSAPAPLNNWRWLSPRSPGPTYRYTGQAPTAAAKPPTTGRSTGPRPRHRGRGLAAWPHSAPLFVGRDGQRLTRGTLQSRLRRAFRLTGQPGSRQPGALAHSLRHTFATELAKSDVSVYTLMNLLGHKSMATSQRYVTAAGTQTRTAAAANPLYRLLNDRNPDATD